MRLARWRHAPLYDGFNDHASRLNRNQRGAMRGRRCIVCIRSWRNQQGGSQKDKLSIIYRATLKYGVAFSKFNTFW